MPEGACLTLYGFFIATARPTIVDAPARSCHRRARTRMETLDLAAALQTPELWCAHFGWRLTDRAGRRVFGVDPEVMTGPCFVSTLGPKWHERLFNHERSRGEL